MHLPGNFTKAPECDNLYVAPGNAGTSSIAENVAIGVEDFAGIKKLVLEKDINLVVVGPEAPLVAGITDFFRSDDELKNVLIIGPSAEASQLEGSKDYAKQFMLRAGIPTGAAQAFTKETIDDAIEFLGTMNNPYVLKADGLAAGKGVLIIDSLSEAEESLKKMLLEEEFGKASETVLIEEHLSGIEVSVFVLTDGKDYLILPEAKDYKRIGEGDSGPNTGGMGAVTPVPFANTEFMQKVEDRIVRPTIDSIQKEGLDYTGFVFIGLMNVGGDPYVIEYNVRMGDPETQAVFPRIQTDFVDLMSAAGKGELGGVTLQLNDKVNTTVIMASGGYPGSYDKGKAITGLANPEALIFHAGTAESGSEIVTSGGRVLAITGEGQSIQEALDRCLPAGKQD